MKDKRKKLSTLKERPEKLRVKKEQQRLKKLAAEGRLANGVEMPRGAIAADLSLQAHNNSYSIKRFYFDIEFQCADCGVEQIWSAADQKWYYEVVKGSIYAGPKRCRDCRRKVRAMTAEQRQRMAEGKRQVPPTNMAD